MKVLKQVIKKLGREVINMLEEANMEIILGLVDQDYIEEIQASLTSSAIIVRSLITSRINVIDYMAFPRILSLQKGKIMHLQPTLMVILKADLTQTIMMEVTNAL